MLIAHDHIFGLDQSILKLKNLDKVIRKVDAISYGLATGVFTQNQHIHLHTHFFFYLFSLSSIPISSSITRCYHTHTTILQMPINPFLITIFHHPSHASPIRSFLSFPTCMTLHACMGLMRMWPSFIPIFLSLPMAILHTHPMHMAASIELHLQSTYSSPTSYLTNHILVTTFISLYPLYPPLYPFLSLTRPPPLSTPHTH